MDFLEVWVHLIQIKTNNFAFFRRFIIEEFVKTCDEHVLIPINSCLPRPKNSVSGLKTLATKGIVCAAMSSPHEVISL